MRNISFMLTTKQFLDGSKDVTRRNGWLFLDDDGELLCAVEKSQGLGKGGKIKRLGIIVTASVRREPLSRMIDEPAYGRAECRREGFPDFSPEQFVAFYCAGNRGTKSTAIITRIEFKRVEGGGANG